MQTRLGEVVQFASTILTLSGVGSGLPALIPPVTASLQKFTDGIRTSRAGSLTRQEILANRDTVKGLLRQLRDDAPKLYEIYRLKRLDDRREALATKNEALAGGVSRDLRQFHASLALYVALIDKTVDAVDALAAAAEAPTSGKPPGITSLFREAMELRRDANTLWDSVRKVGR
jgi:hypothetical protein